MTGDGPAARVVVIGSLVFDIAVRVDRLPRTHETVLTSELTISGGGKGLCQAIAARRLGAQVELIGRVGADVFGEFLIELLDEEGIGHTSVATDVAGTHIGLPIVTADGNNRIIGVPRASGNVSVTDVDVAASALAECDLLLLQGETPLPACHRALNLVGDGAIVVWNPAPATFTLEQMLGAPLGDKVTWFTPNEAEATTLASVEVTDEVSARAAASKIHDLYPNLGIVVTLGDRGSIAVAKDGSVIVTPPYPVDAVDSTAAGDTFSAAFGVALATSMELRAALDFATAAGALTTTRLGAVSSIPNARDVCDLIVSRKH